MKKPLLSVVCGALLAAGCAGMEEQKEASGTAKLEPRSGSNVSGNLKFTQIGDLVRITGEVTGHTKGPKAMHIHEKGDCSAADGSSAGGHFNPTASPHGRPGSTPHHAGDGDNLVADREGVARVNAHFAGVVLGGAAANDVIGRALLVHAAADDYRSQPAGNSGARVACGVIRGGG